MRKLFLSADIEGTCGIADWKETELGEAQGEYFRAEMTKEVAAACEAAIAAGAEDILVKDAHSSGRNIDPSKLPEQARILRSWTRDPQVMMAGLDSSFEGVLFTGYHSPAGSDGNPLAHTMNGGNVWVKINGVQASEFLINAYTAASLKVPVLFLSGDEALCAEQGRRERLDLGASQCRATHDQGGRGGGDGRASGLGGPIPAEALRGRDPIQGALSRAPGIVFPWGAEGRHPRGGVQRLELARRPRFPLFRAVGPRRGEAEYGLAGEERRRDGRQ